jgi:hypothetical protein
MHPYLQRLGIRTQVQQFFMPFYKANVNGDLIFDYGGETETYGFAFHRVPLAKHCWVAGNTNYRQVRQVIICRSAMEAVSFLHLRYTSFSNLDGLLFIAIGSTLSEDHLHWINTNLINTKHYTLLFGKDFLGKVTDLKIAAGIHRIPVSVWEHDGVATVNFRQQTYTIDTTAFSLNAVEKLSGYRFGIRTIKPKDHLTFFDQLKSGTF